MASPQNNLKTFNFAFETLNFAVEFICRKMDLPYVDIICLLKHVIVCEKFNNFQNGLWLLVRNFDEIRTIDWLQTSSKFRSIFHLVIIMPSSDSNSFVDLPRRQNRGDLKSIWRNKTSMNIFSYGDKKFVFQLWTLWHSLTLVDQFTDL